MFTKQHFEQIAKAFKDAEPKTDKLVQELVEKMANIFADSNPRFDKKRFLKACGL